MKSNLENLIAYHVSHYPDLLLKDIYKLLYQCACGPKHILGNEAKARAFLMKEWNAVKADINEPLSDPICPNGKMIRINLRPYKALHGDLETLWIALIESAKITPNNPDFIKTLWGQFKDSCKNQVFHFDPKDLVLFDKKLEKRNYPVMHHSELYREKYHPAYRVIHNETMRDTLLKMQK